MRNKDLFGQILHKPGRAHHVQHKINTGDLPYRNSIKEKVYRPSNIKEVRQFLGLTGHYRFIYHYAHISQPLTKLISPSTPFNWTPRKTRPVGTNTVRI